MLTRFPHCTLPPYRTPTPPHPPTHPPHTHTGHAKGRKLAEEVVSAVGFEPVYVGPIRYARNLEALAELWIHMGVPGLKGGAERMGRSFHFQFIRK